MSLADRIRSRCGAAGYGYTAFSYSRGPGLGEVAAWHLTPRQEAKSMVVFAHGTGCDALFFQASYFFQLLELGYEVFTFDLDGHGARSSTLWEPEGMLTCLDEALKQADLRAQSSTRHLLGYSLGGALLLAYLAKTADPKVRSAVVVACPLSLEGWLLPLLFESRFLSRRAFYRHFSLYGALHMWPVGILRRSAYPIRLASRDEGVAASPFEGVQKLLATLQLETLAARVQTPTLLCYSPGDKLAPWRHGQILAECMPSASLFAVGQETHLTTMLSPLVEERVCAWLRAWL